MSRLLSKFKAQFGIQVNKLEGHHKVRPREEHKAAILSHENPFAIEGKTAVQFRSSHMLMSHKSMFRKSRMLMTTLDRSFSESAVAMAQTAPLPDNFSTNPTSGGSL